MNVIIISSFKLILDTYYSEDDVNMNETDKKFVEILGIFDIIFNGIFIFEMVIKVISLGFLFDYETYLRDSWCQLDFIIVLFSIIDMALSG